MNVPLVMEGADKEWDELLGRIGLTRMGFASRGRYVPIAHARAIVGGVDASAS